ncbi:SymE family type I addiction module toxin [Dyadobacter psychrophilus]|uniref:Toxin SymE, type I toxin-antitoxin system n=1 Tax=Dyadobacter psychrophilus TaxID=651661 RepID=A0A1T5CE12_9BACT|nr:SymE family type I addiction module toxin [Dyadobacter psychrophilus]SKB57708.1 Toxin SymE, type I toxin-antitoxin system [Dyadobacter psychrophilus]
MAISKARTRQLKIYPKFQRTSQWNSKFVPEIRLCGKWLEDMGFNHGEHIMVRFEDDRLIIEPVGELRKNPQLEIWGSV